MGDFFNKNFMNLKKIPKPGVGEQMRKEYNRNRELSAETIESVESIAAPIVAPVRKKRRVRVNGKLVRR